MILIIISAVVATEKVEAEKPNAADLAENGAIGTESDKYVYLQVDELSDAIATDIDDESEKYYIAINNYDWYIVRLTNTELEELKNIQAYTYGQVENKPASVIIYGMTEDVPEKLKEIAVDFYNQGLDEDKKITIDQFENYFGSVMLNVRKSPVDTTTEDLIIVFAGIALIIVAIYHVSIFVVKKRVRKYLKDNQYEEELIDELNNNVEAKYYKDDVILTKNFFVNKKNGNLVVFKYSDVKWIYTSNLKYRGIITTSTSIIARLKDGKTNLQCISINGKETAEFSEVFKKICEKVSDECLKGYTVENEKEYKEYAKEIKRSGN